MSSIVERLRKRAEIRRQIATRKSVQEGKPDRLADLLDEAANETERLEIEVAQRQKANEQLLVDNLNLRNEIKRLPIEALGFAHGWCCSLLDNGKDPRKEDVGALLKSWENIYADSGRRSTA